jgi:hypothetical protein
MPHPLPFRQADEREFFSSATLRVTITALDCALSEVQQHKLSGNKKVIVNLLLQDGAKKGSLEAVKE